MATVEQLWDANGDTNARLKRDLDEALDDLNTAHRRIEDLTDEVAEVERLKDALDAMFGQRCERDATIKRVRALCDSWANVSAADRVRAVLEPTP